VSFAADACAHDATCATCADAAVAMRVVALAAALEPARCVDGDGAVAMVLLDLVEADIGDEVLVHGGVAIARTERGTP
jgi:hydrogenase maturation factor